MSSSWSRSAPSGCSPPGHSKARLAFRLRSRRPATGAPGRPQLNDRHAGGTIVVIGSGPQLAAVSDDSLDRLASFPTIGVNKVFFRIRPTYFLSAYVGEIMLALPRIPEAMLLHMRPFYAPPLLPGVVPLRRKTFQEGMGLPRRLKGKPTLLTRRNVALGATHLAYAMGASRIVFLGVEQRNQLHFWSFDGTLRNEIRAALIARGDPDILRIDHPYASLARDLSAVNAAPEDCMEPFFSVDHTPTFSAYFEILKRNSVDVVATTADSVVADAGARVVPLEEILAMKTNLR